VWIQIGSQLQMEEFCFSLSLCKIFWFGGMVELGESLLAHAWGWRFLGEWNEWD